LFCLRLFLIFCNFSLSIWFYLIFISSSVLILLIAICFVLDPVLNWFFFQFHHSTFGFIVFYVKFNSHSIDYYLFCFKMIFFQFHLWAFSWLIIWLHNFFMFALYGVIPTLWTESWVWKISLSWLRSFSGNFLKLFFFQLYPLILGWLGNEICGFSLYFYSVISISCFGSYTWRVNLGSLGVLF
jgi:hypothetical protein